MTQADTSLIHWNTNAVQSELFVSVFIANFNIINLSVPMKLIFKSGTDTSSGEKSKDVFEVFTG